MWVGMPGCLEGGSRRVRVGGHVVQPCTVTEEAKLRASQMEEGPRAKERGSCGGRERQGHGFSPRASRRKTELWTLEFRPMSPISNF